MSLLTRPIVAAKIGVKPPMHGDDRQRLRHRSKSGIDAADQVDAGGDHRRGVDQRRDRRRAFHRVGQPDVQRELAALADGAREQAQARPEQDRLAEQAGVNSGPRVLLGLVEQLGQLQRAADVPQDDQPDQEADVADAGGDERLLGGDPRRQQVHAAARLRSYQKPISR